MSESTLPDITTPADIDRLVAEFYRRVLADPIIGFLFTDIARIDLAAHLPQISAFWQQQLLGRPVYRGQVFAKHLQLHGRSALTPDHFHRWLHLFTQTLDTLFAGPVAEAAKRRAAAIAASMQTALAQRGSPADVDAEIGVRFFPPPSATTPNNSHSIRREDP